MTYISSQSLTSPMRQSILQMQSALAQAQTEVSTGTVADVGLSLGARTGYSLSLKSQTDQLSTYTATNAVATTRLSTTSSALDSMLSSAQGLSAALVSAQSAGGSTSTLQASATASLQSLISGLNTSVGGQAIFGGIKTDATPIADYFSTTTSSAKQAVDGAFQQAFGTSQTSSGAASISGSDMQAFLSNQFAGLYSDSNYQSTWSSASSTTIQTAISPSQTTTTSVSANSSAFQKLTQAYTMLTEFTGSNLSADARAAVVSTASALVSSGIADLTNLQSGVGVAQSAITNANSVMSTQADVLKSNVSDLESVDTYALSSTVTTLQTQLEASYSLTSRLQQLSLVNYLTGG
jgi:flagellar hook-associated protein 3 FlgL